jgi:hypothetical protein
MISATPGCSVPDSRMRAAAFVDALLERGAAKVYAGVRDIETVRAADPRLVPVRLDVTDADRVAAVAQELGDVELVVSTTRASPVRGPR